MKEKILITMGCSLTEGLGCYDLERIDPTEIVESNKRGYPLLNNTEYSYQRNLFHKNGWPIILAKKLGFDRLINLGLASSSQSGSVKQFVEKYLDTNFSEQEVFIIWMISMPERFSFYNGHKIQTYLPTTEKGIRVDLEKSWIKEIKDVPYDSNYETIFYIRIMEQICQNKNYSLLITSWVHNLMTKLNKIYQSKNYIQPINFQPWDVTNMKKFTSDHYSGMGCGHPNKDGYKLIAENLYEIILKNHSEFVQGPHNENINMIYDGDVLDWKKRQTII
jgi:hypothetical protein